MSKTFVDELAAVALSLLEGGQTLFSSPFHWVCLANGDADFQDNVIFFGFDRKQSEPVLAAKVPRLGKNGWMLKAEYEHLVELWNCMGEKALTYVPRPYAFTSIQDRPVLMLSFIPGESQTRLSRRSFWNDSSQVTGLAREAAGTLSELHRLTARPISPGEGRSIDLQEKAERFRELFVLTVDEDRALTDLVMVLNDKSGLTSQEVLIQGDFWHGNMIRDKQHGLLKLVDWQFARWSSDVSLDVYFFLLAGALSATSGESVEKRAKEAFVLLNCWRSDVIPAYLAAYAQPEHYLLLPQRAGMLLCCVEKAVRSAREFGYSHPDDRMWRYLFAELLQWPAEG